MQQIQNEVNVLGNTSMEEVVSIASQLAWTPSAQLELTWQAEYASLRLQDALFDGYITGFIPVDLVVQGSKLTATLKRTVTKRLAAIEKQHFDDAGILPWSMESEEFYGSFRLFVEYEVSRRTNELVTKNTRLGLVNSIFEKVSDRQGDTKTLKSNNLAVKRSIRCDYEAVVTLITSARVQSMAEEEPFSFQVDVHGWEVEKVYEGQFPWIVDREGNDNSKDACVRRLANRFRSCLQQFERAQEEIELVTHEKELTLMLFEEQIRCLDNAMRKLDTELLHPRPQTGKFTGMLSIIAHHSDAFTQKLLFRVLGCLNVGGDGAANSPPASGPAVPVSSSPPVAASATPAACASTPESPGVAPPATTVAAPAPPAGIAYQATCTSEPIRI